MTTIRLATADQRLFFLEKPIVATGDVNSVEIHVDFDSIWDNYGKEAVFFTEKKRTPIADVLVDGTCKIPSEVLTDACCVFVGVRGVHSDGRIKTTTIVKFKLSEGTPSGGSPSEEPELDVYQKLLSSYGEMQAKIEEAYENAEKIVLQAYEETKELVIEADNATEGKIAIERARIDNLIRTDGCVPHSIVFGESTYPMSKTNFTTTEKDGSIKYMLVSSFVLQNLSDKQIHVLSAGRCFSDIEPPENDAKWIYDDKVTFNYYKEGDTWRIDVTFESDVKIPMENWQFKVIYYYIADIDSAYASIAELNDVRVGKDGTVYRTAGEAVRRQVTKVLDEITWKDLATKKVTNNFLNEKVVEFTYNEELGLYHASIFFNPFKKEDYIYVYTNENKNNGTVKENENGIPYFDPYDLLNGGKPHYEGAEHYTWDDSAIYCTKESGSQYVDWYIYDSTGSTDSKKEFTIILRKEWHENTPLPFSYLDEVTSKRLLPFVFAEENGKHLVVENGNWVLKNYETTGGGSERVMLVENEERSFALFTYFGKYGYGFDTEPFIPIVGEEYIVLWGDDEYTCTAQEAVMNGSAGVGFGNASILGLGEDTNEPFCLMYGSGMFVIFSAENTDSQSFGIYQDTGNGLPHVTAEDNGKFLQVANGKWKAVAITNGNEVAY